MNKKFFYSLILDIIFTILIISSLVISRNITRDYLMQIGDYSGDIEKIKESLGNTNLEDSQIEESTKKIEYVNSIANKALILNQVILPLVILALFFLFQISYWKINSNISLKFIATYSILMIGLLAIFLLSLLNYLEYFFFFTGNKYSLVLAIISLVLVYLVGYIFFILFTRREHKLRSSLIFSLKNVRKLVLQYSFFSLASFVYFVLIALIFVIIFVNYSLIIPGIALFMIILVINIQKYFIVKKIHSLK